MRASPLRLEDSFLENIQFEVVPAFNLESLENPDWPSRYAEWNLGGEITRLEKKGDNGAPHAVRLRVHMGHNLGEGITPPYRFSVQMIGLFSFDDTVPEEKRIRLLEANGPAVLYGSIREILHTLTGRSHFPALLLPTVTFLPAAEVPTKKE